MTNHSLLRDDFLGNNLDSAKWKLPIFTPMNNASFLGRTQLRVSNDPNHEPPKVENGSVTLQLDTYNPSAPGASFLGSELITQEKFSISTGMSFEARVRLLDPIDEGMVASLFSYEISDTNGDGEIKANDLHDELTYEFLTNYVDGDDINTPPNAILTNAYQDMPLGAGDFLYPQASENDDLKTFHEFRIQLYPDRAVWYINDQVVRREFDTVPDEPMDVRLNFWAPAQEWQDAFSSSLIPTTAPENNQSYRYEVDYVDVKRHGVDDYLASYPDLIRAFGYDLHAAETHYNVFGVNEGRVADTFNEGLYLALNPDLFQAFGYDLHTATRHYIEYGYFEGRKPESDSLEVQDFLVGFDPGAYIASYTDLIQAFGANLPAGLEHYIKYGYTEGREVIFEPDNYLASHGDLIQAFGYDLAAASQHYISFGTGENRAKDSFDEITYLNKYADLQAAFGHDLEAATRHFIEFGYLEGRNDGL
ncbi:MAG: glycoside hydrolase family 16 protein [Leptolyngbya sp. SIO1E4]|nr:glycoside hydrolase family 16 protein [Leptolyngbya sp. SIO1E4]